ncbi:hypothetical protein U1Q18_033070 [Sarracenia purpurea var. burkii]
MMVVAWFGEEDAGGALGADGGRADIEMDECAGGGGAATAKRERYAKEFRVVVGVRREVVHWSKGSSFLLCPLIRCSQ